MLTPETRSLLSKAIVQARGAEVCGFLLEHPVTGESLALVRNLETRPGRFVVPDSERRRIEGAALRSGARVASFVHSHANSLRLSDADRLEAGAGDLPWILVALRDGNLRSRRFDLRSG